MSSQLEKLREDIRRTESEKLLKFRSHTGVNQGVRDGYKAYETAVAAAKRAAQAAEARVKQLREDDSIFPDGKRRMIQQAIETAKSEVKTQQGRAEAAMKIIHASLHVAAQPKLDRTREMAARDELRLILDNSRDVTGTMLDLAQRDDELGAIAVSSYGESYLRAKGVQDAKGAMERIRTVAAASASKSNDPERKAAGVALDEMGTLEQSYACTNSIVNSTMDAAQEAGAGA